MTAIPAPIARFLAGRRIAVAGVSRQKAQAANAVFQKLQRSGYEVFPVNPNAAELEGVRCYPDLGAIPGVVEGVVIATHPDRALDVVQQCATHGIRHVWFHRSFGDGSVSEPAVRDCEARGIECIVGGCPLMFCEPVDVGHRCMRWWLQRRGRVPQS